MSAQAVLVEKALTAHAAPLTIPEGPALAELALLRAKVRRATERFLGDLEDRLDQLETSLTDHINAHGPRTASLDLLRHALEQRNATSKPMAGARELAHLDAAVDDLLDEAWRRL